MDRSLEPELLDALPPDHPDALHNRRDLRLTNIVMRNHRWVARTLRNLLREGDRAIEIGAGTGELAQRLIVRGFAVDGLDRCPPPSDWPQHRQWHRADLRTFDRWSDYHVVLGNLIFHQFNEAELAALGGRLADARVIIACEPMRRRMSQVLYAAIAPLLGANHVTLHDARVSIAAGFCDDELPRFLRLEPARWDVRCETTRIGAYHMVAIRRA